MHALYFSTSDIVIWLTLELHHIPHTEDLPVTTTAGMDVSFYLQPYNYFPDDPAMASHNAVRMEPMGMRDIHIEWYNMSKLATTMCVPEHNNYEEIETV